MSFGMLLNPNMSVCIVCACFGKEVSICLCIHKCLGYIVYMSECVFCSFCVVVMCLSEVFLKCF